MRCWSCGKEMPNSAEFCPHCEAEAEAEPTPEERTAVEGILGAMDPDLVNQLRDAFEKSQTGEEFVNRVMVGDCPECGSSNTSDCEGDPEIDDPCIGRCFDCGQLWCLDCDQLFESEKTTQHKCSFWDAED